MRTINIIIEFIQSIDLREIVYAAVGAFLGFWLALKGDSRQEKKKDTDDAMQCIHELITELVKIKGYLNDSSFNTSTKCYIDPLKTPVWNGLISSNSIQYLSKQKQKMESKGKNVLWYKHLFEVYGQIKEFNMWCNLFSEHLFNASIIIGNNNRERISDALIPINITLDILKSKLLQNSSVVDSSPNETSLDELINELENVLKNN